MFELCLPFPGYDLISKEFSQHALDRRTYDIAKAFYINSLKSNTEKIQGIIRKNEPDQERTYVRGLINQAIMVASSYAIAS